MKLVVADLDGTLIYKKKISEVTKQTILKLKKEGYLFTLATGRHKDAVKPIYEELNIDLPVICANGAFMYDFKKKKVIHQEVIEEEVVRQLLSVCDYYEVDYLLYTTESVVSAPRAKQNLINRIGAFNSIVVKPGELKNFIKCGIIKILVIESDEKRLRTLKEALKEFKGIQSLQSQPSFLDIGSIFASKGRALERLAVYLDVSLSEVVAIGDQENDLSMIQRAGLGIAMGNGQEMLKEKASFVTKNFDEDGFSYAIDRFIFYK